ncbi:hypothetical protein ABE021_07680 [Sporosarcina gallistercoris]|uniref:hypothetical protein n=1 Tax=Sporosarcina gallistercoris TaxID=2762245 RepID=UPI003D2C759A
MYLKKVSRWGFTYVVLVFLIALSIHNAMYHPMDYEVVEISDLPSGVQQGMKESNRQQAFSTFEHGDHTYVVYHLNESNSYSSLDLKAHKRFSQPIITATITHAVDDPLVESEKAIKMITIHEKEFKFQVVDER